LIPGLSNKLLPYIKFFRMGGLKDGRQLLDLKTKQGSDAETADKIERYVANLHKVS
jgi:hypothetical protein